MTRKPCPGCGKSERYLFRNKGEVCGACKNLLNEAKEHRRQLEKSAKIGKMSIKVGQFDHWNEGYYEGDLSGTRNEFGKDRDLRQTLLRLMVRLIKTLSAKYYGQRYSIRHLIILKALHYKTRYEENEMRIIDKNLFGLLRGLDKVIRLSIKRSYENGKREGMSLVKMLATGQITIEEFQKEIANP